MTSVPKCQALHVVRLCCKAIEEQEDKQYMLSMSQMLCPEPHSILVELVHPFSLDL